MPSLSDARTRLKDIGERLVRLRADRVLDRAAKALRTISDKWGKGGGRNKEKYTKYTVDTQVFSTAFFGEMSVYTIAGHSARILSV